MCKTPKFPVKTWKFCVDNFVDNCRKHLDNSPCYPQGKNRSNFEKNCPQTIHRLSTSYPQPIVDLISSLKSPMYSPDSHLFSNPH